MDTRYVTIVATDDSGNVITTIRERKLHDDAAVTDYLESFAEEFEEQYADLPVSYAYAINTIH